MTGQITFAEIEKQIAQHQQAIAKLHEVGIRLDEAAKMPGQEVRKWLVNHGATDKEATNLIVEVIRERRATRDEEGRA